MRDTETYRLIRVVDHHPLHFLQRAYRRHVDCLLRLFYPSPGALDHGGNQMCTQLRVYGSSYLHTVKMMHWSAVRWKGAWVERGNVVRCHEMGIIKRSSGASIEGSCV